MTASKTVALPLGDSTIKQTPNELHIIPSIRCIAPGKTQAYKPVSVKKCSLTIYSKESHFERSRLSPFSAIYPCRTLTVTHVGFSSFFYLNTELPKSCSTKLGTSHAG